MKIFVDQQRCQGHGRCVFHAPNLFDFNEEEQGSPIKAPETPGDVTEAQLAQASCPENAIQLVEEVAP